MRPSGPMQQFGFPRPGRVLIRLIAANVICYVLELILIRAGFGGLIEELMLTPHAVFDEGKLWQPFTYFWLHSPQEPSHMLLNVLYLYMFGAQLEEWWGSRRFLYAYFIFALGGAAMTLLVGGLAPLGASLFNPVYWTPHLGASGAVMGITVAWGLTFWNRSVNLLFLGSMTGKTFVLIAVAVELITALSLNPVSSTSHFGGMLAAYILGRGLWRPSTWAQKLKKSGLERRRKRIEADLRVIDGGKTRPKDPREWN